MHPLVKKSAPVRRFEKGINCKNYLLFSIAAAP
jgi:hypothetical protein